MTDETVIAMLRLTQHEYLQAQTARDETILWARQSGCSVAAIAEATGLSRQGVNKGLKRLGYRVDKARAKA